MGIGASADIDAQPSVTPGAQAQPIALSPRTRLLLNGPIVSKLIVLADPPMPLRPPE
jgi:hypothetical protein